MCTALSRCGRRLSSAGLLLARQPPSQPSAAPPSGRFHALRTGAHCAQDGAAHTELVAVRMFVSELTLRTYRPSHWVFISFLEMLPSFLQKVDVVSEASRETCAALSDCLTLLTKQEGVGPAQSRSPAVVGAPPPGRP